MNQHLPCPFLIAAPSVDPTGFTCHRCNQCLQMGGVDIADKFPICIACALVLKVPNAEFAQDFMELCAHGGGWIAVITMRSPAPRIMMRWPLRDRSYCQACIDRLSQRVDGKLRIVRLVQFMANNEEVEPSIAWATPPKVATMFNGLTIRDMIYVAATSESRPKLLDTYNALFKPTMN